MATQSIPDFEYKPEQYAVHNARPEPVDFMWGGLRFTIPPVDVVGPKPSVFDDGAPVPGSLLVSDSYAIPAEQMPGMGGKGPHTWKAKEAIRAVLGVQPGGQATSQLAKNGVSFLPVGCTRAEFERIKAAGEERYRDSLVVWATDTVQNYEEARNRAKQAGVDTRPPGPDFYRAQAILQAYQKKQMSSYEATSVEASAEAEELEFMVYAKAKAMKLAENIAESENVDKAKLVEKLLQDPKVIGQLRKKYSWRKKGYLDPEVAPPGAELSPEDKEQAEEAKESP